MVLDGGMEVDEVPNLSEDNSLDNMDGTNGMCIGNFCYLSSST